VKDLNLKKILLQEIVNNNIWTDEDLDVLFEKTREEYKDLEVDKLEEAIEFVRKSIF
jgi:hypothetical protein